MRVVFCDDNAEELWKLQSLVEDYFRTQTCEMPEFAAYTSGSALLEAETAPDIVFLDVVMPGENGICIGAKLKERNPRVKLFVTTLHPDYLDDAMRVQVFRYLSKPIDPKRLYRNLDDALRQYRAQSREFALPVENGVLVCAAEELVCVEASDRKVYVHTLGGTFRSTEPLDYYRRTLTLPCFYSTHRSYIVNMRYVKKITTDTVFLRYNGQDRSAYLTCRKYWPFRKVFLSYLEENQ